MISRTLWKERVLFVRIHASLSIFHADKIRFSLLPVTNFPSPASLLIYALFQRGQTFVFMIAGSCFSDEEESETYLISRKWLDNFATNHGSCFHLKVYIYIYVWLLLWGIFFSFSFLFFLLKLWLWGSQPVSTVTMRASLYELDCIIKEALREVERNKPGTMYVYILLSLHNQGLIIHSTVKAI